MIEKKKEQKYMSFWMLVALVSGNMVGSGIFLLPSGLAKFGSISILAWILTTIGSILLAFVFSNLSKIVPKVDGGPYIYVRIGMGKFLGFQSGFGYWVSLWIGNCAISLAMVGYLSFFFPFLSDQLYASITAILIVWIISSFNMFGAQLVGWIQLLLMIIKSSILLFIILSGIWYIQPHYYLEFNRTNSTNLSALSSASALTLWAFIGLESAAVTASKVKNPKKTIPLATLTGTLIAALMYIASSMVIMGTLPASKLVDSNAPFSLAAKEIMGQKGAILVTIMAIISCLGTLNGWIMITAVISKSIAETNLFPKVFCKENDYGAPIFSLLLSAGLMTILLLFTTSQLLIKQFELLVLMAVLTTLLPYFYTTISNILVIKKKNKDSSPYQEPIIISILACMYSFWAIVGLGQEVVYYGVILFFLGTPIYAIAEWLNIQKEN